MAGKRLPIVYWDTCVLLAWIKDEVREPGAMEGVTHWARLITQGKVVLLTSVITRTEVLASHMTPASRQKLSKMMNRSLITEAMVDPRIADKASDLRSYYEIQKQQDGLPGLCVPDAIHLATAINYGAAQFHTFDESHKRGCRGLLSLDGNVAGNKLTVCRPTADQPLGAQGALRLGAQHVSGSE